VFLVPFTFIIVTAGKTQAEASFLEFTWPTEWVLFDNIVTVLQNRDYPAGPAFVNSTILTVARRASWSSSARWWATCCSAGSRAGTRSSTARARRPHHPARRRPQHLGHAGPRIFKTLAGLGAMHVAFGLSFCILLFRAFVATIPRELDEAAIIDGAGPVKLFFRVIFPLLKSVIVTVIVVQAVVVFNDFTYALYFLPGDENATVQLTTFNYISQSVSSYNLLFADVLLITIPPLIMYILFQRQIVAGMTSGAVKGVNADAGPPRTADAVRRWVRERSPRRSTTTWSRPPAAASAWVYGSGQYELAVLARLVDDGFAANRHVHYPRNYGRVGGATSFRATATGCRAGADPGLGDAHRSDARRQPARGTRWRGRRPPRRPARAPAPSSGSRSSRGWARPRRRGGLGRSGARLAGERRRRRVGAGACEARRRRSAAPRPGRHGRPRRTGHPGLALRRGRSRARPADPAAGSAPGRLERREHRGGAGRSRRARDAARPGRAPRRRWTTRHPLGFRYVVVRSDAPPLDSVTVRAAVSVVARPGAFACSDEQLTRIWAAAQYTLRLCMQGLMIDGIKRDRMPWAGDQALSTLANAYALGEGGVVADGLVALGRPDHGYVNGIADYSLWWVVNSDLRMRVLRRRGRSLARRPTGSTRSSPTWRSTPARRRLPPCRTARGVHRLGAGIGLPRLGARARARSGPGGAADALVLGAAQRGANA
jgi:raffinose/stachyose/melibiose transport system permease protein